MSLNPLDKLNQAGTSVWYDNLSRDLLESGGFQNLIDDYAVRGVTSNPTIFNNAIAASDIYDDAIEKLKAQELSAAELFEVLAVEDVGSAADMLLPVFEQSGGIDGYVSIEVSPLLARDAEATVTEAKRLYSKLSRPNIFIKVPGTPEGLPAVHALLEEGINVNVTLLFSVENYIEVARTYCSALQTRAEAGKAVDTVRSVASFFVSRVDSMVDKMLDERASQADVAESSRILELRGKYGIANSKLAYLAYREIFEGSAFSELRDKGALVQRPLWASTSVKNPEYRDVMYIEELIGANTVNTMPHTTLEAFREHGEVRTGSVESELARAKSLPQELASVGIELDLVFKRLQEEGIQKFIDSFLELNETLERKVAA